MPTRTDNVAEVGMHVFERAGLGNAPFKVVGSYEMKWQACPGAPIQPGGSCDYCGQGIMYAVAIRSADGQKFKVGSDCVHKTGDAGLIKQFKSHPDVRKRNRDKAAAKDVQVQAEWAAIMADAKAKSVLAAHRIPAWAPGKYRPWLEYAENAWRTSGMAGRARVLKTAKKILAGEV